MDGKRRRLSRSPGAELGNQRPDSETASYSGKQVRDRWNDEGVAEVGGLLRLLHRATSTFAPPVDAYWQPWFGRELPGSEPVISHCDLGPWNIIARDGLPVAFVDWEFVGPVDARWDLAHTAWLNAQRLRAFT